MNSMTPRRSPRFQTFKATPSGNNNPDRTDDKASNGAKPRSQTPKEFAKTASKVSTDSNTTNGVEFLPRTRQAELMRDGYTYVVGVDEAGRGPLAGPVVAAAAWVPTDLAGVCDSKKLTKEERRQELYGEIVNSPDVQWAVAIVDARTIDEINILQATLLAMTMATQGLLEVYHQQKFEKDALVIHRKADVEHEGCYVVTGTVHGVKQSNNNTFYALVDGNRMPPHLPCDGETMVKGDSREYSIAAASILAKVTRDELMHGYHALYPAYNLEQHKGYPTAAHMAAVFANGASPIHRRTFAPLKHMEFDEHGKILSLDKKDKVQKSAAPSNKDKPTRRKKRKQ